MSKRIFLNYSKQELDAEYDNRAKVKDFQVFFEYYKEESRAVRDEMDCRLDIPYGAGPREKLDIFPVSSNHKTTPILLFIHGGYWKVFSKDDFSFVARGFVQTGVTVVIIGYTLIPHVSMDELVHQCRRAVSWTWKNAGSFGGDKNRLYVAGHSAGGHIVGMLLATDWQRFDNLPGDVIKGGCGISGIYDLKPIRLCYLNGDLNLTVEEAARNSPSKIGPACHAELLLAVGDQEGPEYLRQTQEMAAVWRDQGQRAAIKILQDIHHFNIVAQLIGAQEELSRAILNLIGNSAI